MTNLPEHRRAINGRTWSQPFNHADYDPIVAYRRTIPLSEKLLGVTLAIAIGVTLASLVAYRI